MASGTARACARCACRLAWWGRQWAGPQLPAALRSTQPPSWPAQPRRQQQLPARGLAGLAACSHEAPPTADAATAAAADPTRDEHYMRLALQQAALAAAAGEVPVGAVLVSAGGEVLAAAHNCTEGAGDPTAHAELLCIRHGAAAARGWRLLDATLYVTLEPCPMCAGALLQSRVGTVVYGARNSLLGADGSWIAMLPQAPPEAAAAGSTCCDATSEQGAGTAGAPARPHPFHPNLQVRRGVLAADCGELMRAFFARRRREAAAAAAAAAADGEG